MTAMIWLGRWAGGGGELRPEVHGYLADRYGRLARYYEGKGKLGKAESYDNRALFHYARGGQPDPPPLAAAAAMAVPKPPFFTRAVAEPPEPPDEAAW